MSLLVRMSGMALPPVVAAALLPFRDDVNLVSDALLLLLAVVAAGLMGGLAAGLVAAVTATFLLNFFFTPPFHTLRVADPNNAVALLVFASVAVLVSWAVDQSERRRAEAVRASSLEAATNVRTALLAAVGHDLRTPLAAAKASITGLLSEDVELPPEDREELLRGADESLDRLTSLVADILDLSRLQLGAMPVVRRATAVEEVVARALDTIGLRSTTVDLPEELPEVLADPALLERVVANLLDNACRYAGTARVSAAPVDGRLVLTVTDRGPGIPDDAIEGAFQPFQRMGDTSNTEGLGLGLAVARGLVEAMGGTLVPSSPPGGGLVMAISLEVVP